MWAESRNGTGRSSTSPPEPDSSTTVACGASTGACSNTTCAFVPLMLNADTPARRGRPVSGQGVASVASATVPALQSTCGVGVPTCSVGGTTPCWRASTALSTPATPAAAWV